jgi:hypothetical protein
VAPEILQSLLQGVGPAGLEMEHLQGRGAATGLPSRGVHLLDPVVGALPWGHPSGAPSLELPRVQMVSLSLLLVVGETRLLAAPRAGEGHFVSVLQPDADPLVLDVQVRTSDRPTGFYTEGAFGEVRHLAHSPPASRTLCLVK